MVNITHTATSTTLCTLFLPISVMKKPLGGYTFRSTVEWFALTYLSEKSSFVPLSETHSP